MLTRAAPARQALRQCQRPVNCRGLATPASSPFQYQTGEAQGIKFASRDLPGPVASVAIVAKAGTRHQFLPGLAEALKLYAFKGTDRRSTLRIQRESELLGSELHSFQSRENLVISTKFLRDDLPYFVELLSEVLWRTDFKPHVVDEEILPLIALSQRTYLANTLELAQNSAHGLAFHRGLGEPLKPSSSTPIKKYVNATTLAEFAASAYAKPNFAIVGNGVEQSALNKWVSEFFEQSPAPAEAIQSQQSKYYGGEERIAHAGGNSLVLAFPGSSSATGSFYKPEVSVLAALLGGQSSIKWSPGFSLLSKIKGTSPTLHVATNSNVYSDAGLLSIELSGAADEVRSSAEQAVAALKSIAESISKEDLQKAKALAKFRELEHSQTTQAGLELTGTGLISQGKPYQFHEVAKSFDDVTEAQVKKIAKEALESKASVAAVGDLFVLPYGEEIGLKV